MYPANLFPEELALGAQAVPHLLEEISGFRNSPAHVVIYFGSPFGIQET